MDKQASGVTDAQILQIMVTEHSNLQAIRSGTIFEANGRTNLFLGTVSSVVIALAFVGQVTEMSGAFMLFALILLPSLLFIGLQTFIRVEQAGLEDMMASRGINRIRHYYKEIAPITDKFFILSTHDDMSGFLWNMGVTDAPWQILFSAAGLVSVINGILAAVFIGLAFYITLQPSAIICICAGVAVFTLCVLLSFRYQHSRWKAINSRIKVLYPSENQRAS